MGLITWSNVLNTLNRSFCGTRGSSLHSWQLRPSCRAYCNPPLLFFIHHGRAEHFTANEEIASPRVAYATAEDNTEAESGSTEVTIKVVMKAWCGTCFVSATLGLACFINLYGWYSDWGSGVGSRYKKNTALLRCTRCKDMMGVRRVVLQIVLCWLWRTFRGAYRRDSCWHFTLESLWALCNLSISYPVSASAKWLGFSSCFRGFVT